MLNFSLFGMQVPSPTDIPPDELLDKAERVIGIWDSLGPLMAILGLMALVLIVVGIVVYFNRNNSSTAIQVLAKVSDRQDKEIERLVEQRKIDQEKFIESISVIAAQATRSNDLFEVMNTRGGQRDSQQQRLVESQAQIAIDLKSIVTQGSAPVQEIRAKVIEVLGLVTRIDSRTANWDDILIAITPLLAELGELRTIAKKHKTQPIPQIDPTAIPSGEITIEGTVKGTVIEETKQ